MIEVNLLADYQSELPVGADAVTTTIADLSKKRVVVALGMHRSGTSLLTGLLGELGVELGDKFLPADANNESGYWEHSEINRVQDSILDRLRKNWDGEAWMNPLPLDWRQLDAGQRRRFKQELSVIVREELSNVNGIWGFKDPRTMRLLPLWKEIFAELGIKPAYILTIRDPGEVIASIVKRDNATESHAGILWLLHNLEAVREAGDQLKLVVSYDRWFTHPQEQARAIIRALDLTPPRHEQALHSALARQIRPDLRHWQSETKLSLPFVDETYQLLKQAGETGKLPEGLSRVDAILRSAFAIHECVSGLFGQAGFSGAASFQEPTVTPVKSSPVTMSSPEMVAQAARLFDAGAKPVAAPLIVAAPIFNRGSKTDSRAQAPIRPTVKPIEQRTTQKQESAGVIQEIGAGDEMFSGNRAHYFAVGESAMHGIQAALNTAQKPARTIRRILDLPCGHGRVMRHLKAAFAEAQITACDLNRGAVDFCARTFGAEPIYSNVDVNQIPVQGKFDLIWCGSLLTHLRPQPCADLVKWFHSRMNAGSMLFFTMHGRWVERSLATRRYTYGLTEQAVTTILAEYYRDGFGYADYPGQPGYGISVSSPAFVLSKLVGLPDLKLVAYTEKGWDNHQDIICVQRQPPGELLG